MSKVMRIEVSKRGGPDVLKVVESEIEAPTAGEVQIQVKAAGVAFADILIREGLYPGVPARPFVPGYDISGVVTAVGPGVSGLKLGQPVVAMTQFGGYAERVNLAAQWVVPHPTNLDHSEAVSLVLSWLTAYQILHRVARVSRGERLLIHGAAGGVGTAMLALGQRLGLEMYGTASAAKHRVVESYGATPIDYRSQDFEEVVMGLTGDGVDAIYDPIGGSHWKASFRTLRPGGRLVACGFSVSTRNGRRDMLGALKGFLQTPKYSLLTIFESNRAVCGYNAWSFNEERPDAYSADLKHLLELLGGGEVSPYVEQRLPLQEAHRAHELLGTGKVRGKVVLIAG